MPERELVSPSQGRVRDWRSSTVFPSTELRLARRPVDPAVAGAASETVTRPRHPLHRSSYPRRVYDLEVVPAWYDSTGRRAQSISRSFSRSESLERTLDTPGAFCPVFAAAAFADGVGRRPRTRAVRTTVRRSGDLVAERPRRPRRRRFRGLEDDRWRGREPFTLLSPAMQPHAGRSMASAATAGPNVRVRPGARGFARSGWVRSTGRCSAERSTTRLPPSVRSRRACAPARRLVEIILARRLRSRAKFARASRRSAVDEWSP
jgi:hypothetical protein